MDDRTTKPASSPRKLAMVITATSRWATWDSSWESTASSSGSSSRRMIPRVTHSTALFWLRPVANALGMSESAMATRGLGMSARAQSRSTMPCSTGASRGETSRACIENSAIRSEKKYCTNKNPPAMITISAIGTFTAIRTATKATYTNPIRNIVSTMRLESPRSAGKRERAITTSPRDETLLTKDLSDLFDSGVRTGQDQIGRPQVVVGQLAPGGADTCEQSLQGVAEAVLVAGIDRLEQILVESVQLLEVSPGDVELPLTDDPDDHRCSSCAGALSGCASRSPCASRGAWADAPSCLAVVEPPVSSPLMRDSSASTMVS